MEIKQNKHTKPKNCWIVIHFLFCMVSFYLSHFSTSVLKYGEQNCNSSFINDCHFFWGWNISSFPFAIILLCSYSKTWLVFWFLQGTGSYYFTYSLQNINLLKVSNLFNICGLVITCIILSFVALKQFNGAHPTQRFRSLCVTDLLSLFAILNSSGIFKPHYGIFLGDFPAILKWFASKSEAKRLLLGWPYAQVNDLSWDARWLV